MFNLTPQFKTDLQAAKRSVVRSFALVQSYDTSYIEDHVGWSSMQSIQVRTVSVGIGSHVEFNGKDCAIAEIHQLFSYSSRVVGTSVLQALIGLNIPGVAGVVYVPYCAIDFQEARYKESIDLSATLQMKNVFNSNEDLEGF